MLVARVMVDVRTRALAEPLDYLVPTALEGAVSVGVPVLVPLGGRHAVGYVVETADHSAFQRLREIADVVDETLFDEAAYRLARWIAAEYAAHPIDALRLMIPPGAAPSVSRVIQDGQVKWVLRPRTVRALDENIVELVDPAYAPTATARLQRSLIAALAEGPVSVPELTAGLGAVSAAIKALQKRGVVRITARRRWRGSAAAQSGVVGATLALTSEQTVAVDTIANAAPGSIFVLDGVTGSGKTEVYLRAIAAVMEGGGGAIVLVPEISLTPQTVGRFRSRFGDSVAVLHSRLSDGERFDQWSLAARGDARVVVGARSALFAPVRDLRLVIIDEEHEGSYKQGSAPRYHARDVAAHMAITQGITLVLGSATPGLEAREHVERGAWDRLVLSNRATPAPPPQITVVDMGAEFKSGNRSMFSTALAREIDGVVERGSKAVLFLNRRGFASFLLCRECGFVPECPSCSISLTYHDRGDVVRCHHCGHTESAPHACPKCSSPYLRRFGAGTQRVEAELQSRWPEFPVVRMDADTTSGKGGHERALSEFEALPSGILLGTQMIAKGLDYPDVDVVGVINADTTMHVPDFRAAERTFQMLEQVAGRAGRGTRQGQVVIQTYWPDHPAVLAVLARDSEILYREERANREALGYPPYRRLANVLLSGADQHAVEAASHELASQLRAAVPGDWDVLGPADAPISKIKRAYRRHVMLRAPVGAPLGELLGRILGSFKSPDGVSIAPDIDPIDLL
ncbi:MAG: replication restart helicase PriA [Coriobacteriia bacterium]